MNLDYFFSAERSAAALVNGVIALLLVYAVARLFWDGAVTLPGEQRRIQRLGSVENPDPTRCREVVEEFPASSPLRCRVELLAKIRARHQPIDVAPLSAITTEQFRQQAGTVRFLSPIFVLLGLFGTVLGLGTSVTELASLLTGGMSTEALRTGILETLGGMKTAFSTTLAGILASITVGLALRLHARLASRTLRELESLSAGTLVPIFDTSEASILDLSVTRLQSLTDSLENRLGVITEKLENRGNALELTIRRGFEEVTAQFTKQVGEVVAGLRSVRGQILDIIGEPEPGTSTLAYHVSQFGQVADRLRQSTEAARQLLPEMQQAIAGILRQHHEEIVRDLSARAEATQTTLTKQEEATRGLQGAVQAFTRQANTMADDLSGLATASNRFAATWEDVAESLQSAEGALTARLDTMGQELRAYLKQLQEDHGKVQLPVLQALRGFEDSLAAALRLLGDEPQRYSRQADELLSELRQVFQRNFGVVNTLAKEHQNTNQHVSDALRLLQREVRDAAVPRPLSAGERRHLPEPVPAGGDATLASGTVVAPHARDSAKDSPRQSPPPEGEPLAQLHEFYDSEEG